MKRWLCMGLCMLLCTGLLAGCGTTLDSDSSVVYVDEKGKVISLDVENMEEEYYDQAELEAFVNEQINAYTEVHGKDTVKLDSLKVVDGIGKLKMEYESAQVYSDFNGIELFSGTVVEALAEAYIFDGDFVRVENGQVTGAVTKQEIYAEPDLKVVIIRANTDVKIAGEICYVSCENVKLTGTDSVSIRNGYYLEGGNGSAVESVYGTEAVEATEGIEATEVMESVEAVDGTELNFGAEASDNDSFETDVYTFIVYK